MVHPGARLTVAISFVIVALSSSLPLQTLIVACGWLLALLQVGGNKQNQSHLFLRIWLTSGIFLALIHMLSFEGGSHIAVAGFKYAVTPFLRIGAIMASCLWLIATIRSEAFYAMLIDLKVPMQAIYLIYKVLYFIPRMADKGREILEAQQARGYVLSGVKNRAIGLLLVLAPLMSSTIYELETSSAAIMARGILSPTPKTHLAGIRFSASDFAIILASTLMASIAVLR